jgi:hypothetical protein
MRQTKPDPYNRFKDDRERRRALNTRARSQAIPMVAIALATASTDWMGVLRWLKLWVH